MSAGHKTIHPDEKVKAGNFGSQLAKIALPLGLAAIAAAFLLGPSHTGYRHFQLGYLTAWMFVWSIACGSLFFVMIHHLARARWSTVLRRVAENIALTFPLLGVVGFLGIVLPMLAGNHDLYYWDYAHTQSHEWQHVDHHLAGKLGWLSSGFFAGRFVLYMAIYSLLAYWFAKTSKAQDESGDPKLSEKMRIAAGPGILVFALTTVFVGFDLMMSLAPKWYSTIYSVNLFGGAMIATYAFLAIFTRAVQRTGRIVHSVTVEHYHDLGKLLFGFIFFWAYTAFSQFMLIWYADIPEEVVFYNYRMFGGGDGLSGWANWSIALLLCQWAIPYVLLLSRWTKRILPILMAISVWALVWHWVDLYWNIMPNAAWGVDLETGRNTGPLTGLLEANQPQYVWHSVLIWLGMVGVFLGFVGTRMKGNLLPVKDPMLGPSLAFENY
jgi:hypothetical protein